LSCFFEKVLAGDALVLDEINVDVPFAEADTPFMDADTSFTGAGALVLELDVVSVVLASDSLRGVLR
jgi:hypothetical protein